MNKPISPHTSLDWDSKKTFRKKYHKKYSDEDRKKNRETHRKHYHKRKREAIEHYGGNPPKCACCGEKEYLFLTIDHIDGGGRLHRRTIKKYPIYGWLVNNNFPGGFQVLCFNCNCGKSINKNICPHRTKNILNQK